MIFLDLPSIRLSRPLDPGHGLERLAQVDLSLFLQFIFFQFHPLIFYLLGMKFYFFLLLFYRVILILCDGLHVNSSWLRLIFFVRFIYYCCLFFNILLNLLSLLDLIKLMTRLLIFLSFFMVEKLWFDCNEAHTTPIFWFY
jgi:hypothetical protein